ncbi:MAG: hypothetical protein QOH68_4255 [Nocardioidaceae bacterium]|jgi:hypothetical protein|nr:hypothetical protein [Nocardioidaceae bacterium]
MGGSSVEVVRGRLTEAVSDELGGFWTEHRVLDAATARRRVDEVIALLRDPNGRVIGVNSVTAADVPLVANRRFWLYRRFLAPGAPDDAEEALLATAYDVLDEEPDLPERPPRGLCVVVADPAILRRFPEAVWPGTQLLFVGYTATGAQVRIRYFERDWSVSDGTTLDPRFERHVLGESDSIGPDEVKAFWRREGALSPEEAARRIAEVLHVVTEVGGPVVGVSSAYLQANRQLGLNFWHYRTFVAPEHRKSSIAAHLALNGRELLEQRFAAGVAATAAGILLEIENEGLKRHMSGGLWPTTGFTFVGENTRGDHVRVRYFPGVLAPPPPVARNPAV